MTQRRSWIAVTALGMIMAALVLRFFPPERYGFYPPCPVALLLRLQCPGCGATRALSALLRGELAAAWRLNALLVLLLPVLAGYAALSAWRGATAAHFCWPEPPRWMVPAGCLTAVMFAIGRNL